MTTINGIDYGPIAGLLGTWTGNEGTDVAPEPDGTERSPYFEIVVFSDVGIVTNAERQNLAAIHYHQIVSRIEDGKVFHNETGYWMWEAETGTVMHSLHIPRGAG